MLDKKSWVKYKQLVNTRRRLLFEINEPLPQFTTVEADNTAVKTIMTINSEKDYGMEIW